MHEIDEKILVGWCDSGTVEGRMADSLIYTILQCNKKNIIFDDVYRCVGNQISRQRQFVFDYWENKSSADWLLFLDSDITIFPDTFEKLWKIADKNFKPIVCGVYLISDSPEGHAPNVYPSIYKYIPGTHINDSKYIFDEFIKNRPEGKVVEIDAGGLGYTLIHRSIIKKIKDSASNKNNIFAESYSKEGDFISEDIAFFDNVRNAGIPIYAHTGAFGEHMKTLPLSHIYINDVVLPRNK